MSLFGVVGFGALAVVIVGWLVISFTSPSPRRAVLEWLSTLALYVALLSLFLNLTTRALAADSLLGTIAFGFLAIFFTTGLIVSAYRLIRSFAGSSDTGASATN